MASSIPTLLFAVLAVVLALIDSVISMDGMDTPYPCPDSERVCSSTLRVGPKGRKADSDIKEGPYCTCTNCPPLWDETGDQSLTWHHHERPEWIVQYKFCEPIMPKKTCAESNQIAAVVEAGANGWSPRLKSVECRCQKGHYYLKGWWLEGNTHWNYHYTCERHQCVENAPCVRHYLDEQLEKTSGYRFLCACAEGICPTNKLTGKVKKADGTDSEGPYVDGYCQKIQPHFEDKYKEKLKENQINKS